MLPSLNPSKKPSLTVNSDTLLSPPAPSLLPFPPPNLNYLSTKTNPAISKKTKAKPLTAHNVELLNKLLFGSRESRNLPKSWRQGFIFNEKEELTFGLLQKEGGPCGVLACVQAYLIKNLVLFGGGGVTELKKEKRMNCLIAALSEMLWKVAKEEGGKRRIYLVSGGGNGSLLDCEGIEIFAGSLEEVYIMVYDFKKNFVGEGNCGVAYFLFSAVLSRGVEEFMKGMDVQDNHIIGAHSTCTQELVNFLLVGVSSSNASDGNMMLGEGIELKGIPFRSEVKFFPEKKNCIF
jgi:hypothetical protein